MEYPEVPVSFRDPYRRAEAVFLCVLVLSFGLFVGSLAGLFVLLARGVIPGDVLPLLAIVSMVLAVWLGPLTARRLSDRVLRHAGIRP